MFENYELDDADDLLFVPDWQDESEDDHFDQWQVVFVDDELPSMWESVASVDAYDFGE